MIHKGTAFIGTAVKINFLKAAIVIERQAAVEKEVVIKAAVHGTVAVEEAHMLLQPFTLHKFILKFCHDAVFFRRKRIGIGRIKGRKIRRRQFIRAGIKGHCPRCQIDFME